MCYQRVIRELEIYDKFVDNPYNISLRSKRNVITGTLMARCSIINDHIVTSVKVKDGENGWILPKGSPTTEMIITNSNNLQALFDFFVAKEDQNDTFPPL
jgi:hypothetical protein